MAWTDSALLGIQDLFYELLSCGANPGGSRDEIPVRSWNGTAERVRASSVM